MKEIVKFTIMDRDEVLKAISRGEIADMDWNTPNYKREILTTSKTIEQLEAELTDNIIHSRRYGETRKVIYVSACLRAPLQNTSGKNLE